MTRKRRQRERDEARKARSAWGLRDALSRAVAVDPGAFGPRNHSITPPDFVSRGYYVDRPFVCRDCGESEVWTAERQKWWYEVAKGSIHSQPTRCLGCRRRYREQKGIAPPAGRARHLYRTPGQFLAELRSEIESTLLLAGFCPVEGIGRGGRHLFYLDYSRAGDVLTLSWNRYAGRLSAELLTNEGAEVRVIADVEIPRYQETSETEARIASFLASMGEFLDGLRGMPTDESDSDST